MTCLLLSWSRALAARLRIAEVKQRLTRFGVSTTGIVEAAELREMLKLLPPEAAAEGYAVPLERVRCAEDAMGAGATVYDKTYYGVRLELEASAAASVPWVIDSAASNSLLTPAAASLLAARATGVVATADTASSVGDGGLRQVDVGAVALAGGLESGRLQPVVMELPVEGACGLLGLDFLARHDVDLRLRPVSPCAVFHPAGSAARGDVDNTAALSCLPCARLPSGLLTTPMTPVADDAAARAAGSSAASGAAVPSIVDLGSPLTLLNWEAAACAGLSRDDPRVTLTDDVIAGAAGEPIRVAEATLSLRLSDGATRERVLVNIADLPIFGAVGLRGAAAVLGLDSLAPRSDKEPGSRVVLAAADAQVWVETRA